MRRGIGALTIVAGLAVVLVPAMRTAAIPVSPFGVAFSTNDNGAIFTIGNNLLTCPASAPTCAAARAGTITGANSSNNAYDMVNLDADDDATTFNSSSSDLLLPAGSSVLWAGLFWGARQTGDPRSKDTTAPIGQMSLRVPGAANYQTVASTKTYGPTGTGDLAYQQFANITAAVQAAGNGSYWGGNVAAGLGRDRYAGWSMVVVYRNPTQPLRNLTVFDGFSDIAVNSSEVINVAGFLTPLSGTVDARVNIMAYEGDRGATGDSAFLNSTRMATAASPGTNFFNSSNDLDGRSVTTRTPADDDMLGFDITRTGVPGAIPNGATSATVTVSTTSERYYVGWVATQINLYAPDFTSSRKTATNLAGRDPAATGDTIEYTLTYVNTGGDASVNSVATDPLPPNTTYVPGSLRILDGPNAGPKTDGGGDDQAEVIGAAPNRSVRVRLGTGAGASVGGTIAPGATTTVRFQVTADNASAGTTVRNRATLDYVGQTVNQPLTYVGNETANPVVATADLRVAKVTTPATVAAGSDATSTISLTNDGPAAATNVVVTDALSAGVVPISATVPGGTCTITGQNVTCTIATLANAASVAVTVVGRTAPNATITTFTDLANASSDTIDPDPTDNTAGATVDVARRANLTITKVAGVSAAAAGAPVTYTIRVTNNGPSTAVGVVATDTLDARLVAVGTAAAPCVQNGQAATCSFGDLAPGQSAQGTVTVALLNTVAPGTVVPNTARVSSLTPDPTPADNAATASLTAAPPQADLVATKTASPSTVVAGNQVVYTINVRNDGPSTAPAVAFTDVLPAGVVATSVATTRGTCTPAPVGCAIGAMPLGSTTVVTVTATVGPDAALGSAVNTAHVTSGAADPNLGDDDPTAPITITGQADVSLTKAGAPNPVVAGGTVAYTLVATNGGPSRARGVVITDVLPPAFDGAATATPGCSIAAATLTCAVGELAVGATSTAVVTLDVPAGFPGGNVTNTASVATSTVDPTPANDQAAFTSSTSASADLSMTKSAPVTVVAGTGISWQLVVANAGPSAATGVTITDTLPPGLANVATTTPGCAATVTAVTCSGLTVASASSSTVTITADVLPGGEAGERLTNSATVTAATLDPTSSNNSAATSTDVTYVADVTVTKSVIPASVAAGTPVGFLITVSNAGPSTARGVSILDTFDQQAAVAQAPDGCAITDGGQLACPVADIPPGGSQVLQVVAVVFEPAGTYTNFVTAAATTPENDTTNNGAQAPVVLTDPVVDLTLAKAGPPQLLAGGRFTYILTLGNDGESIALNATVTDTLPAGLVPDAATSDSGACTIVAQAVTCTPQFVFPHDGVFGPAPPVTITITGDVAAGIAGATVANTASATTVGEIDPSNNSATVTTPIVREANVTVVKQAATDTFVAGGTVGYAISITNTGPSAATDAALTDVLPAGLTFDPAQSDPVCSIPTPGAAVSCDLATVPVGTTVTVRIAGQLDPAYADATLGNSATFDSDATAPVASGLVTTPVVRSADLGLTKVATGDAVAAGSLVEYTLTVDNAGPSTATAVSFDDQLPAGTTLASVTPTAPLTCTTLPCAVGSLPPGGTASVVIEVAVPANATPGPLRNTAVAESPTSDPNPGRRTASADVEIIRNADVSVRKVLRTEPVVAGAPVRYDLVVSNAGPSDAADVLITDAIPAGTSLVSGTLGGPPCESVDVDAVPTVSCALALLPVGQTVIGTLTLDTDPSLTGILSNTAVVGSQALDRADADNVSRAEGVVVAPIPSTVPPVGMAPGSTAPLQPARPVAPATGSPAGPTGGTLPVTGLAIGGSLVAAGGLVLLGGGVRAASGGRRRTRRRRR